MMCIYLFIYLRVPVSSTGKLYCHRIRDLGMMIKSNHDCDFQGVAIQTTYTLAS